MSDGKPSTCFRQICLNNVHAPSSLIPLVSVRILTRIFTYALTRIFTPLVTCVFTRIFTYALIHIFSRIFTCTWPGPFGSALIARPIQPTT